MPADPKQVQESRKTERENLLPQERQRHALEQIADTLESIRAELEKLTAAIDKRGS